MLQLRVAQLQRRLAWQGGQVHDLRVHSLGSEPVHPAAVNTQQLVERLCAESKTKAAAADDTVVSCTAGQLLSAARGQATVKICSY